MIILVPWIKIILSRLIHYLKLSPGCHFIENVGELLSLPSATAKPNKTSLTESYLVHKISFKISESKRLDGHMFVVADVQSAKVNHYKLRQKLRLLITENGFN